MEEAARVRFRELVTHDRHVTNPLSGNDSVRIVCTGDRTNAVPLTQPRGPPCVLWDDATTLRDTAALMEYTVVCHHPKLLEALCAFVHELAALSDPRNPRGILPVLIATLLVALARSADSMAAVDPFTHDY